jgi:hypothetical protein
MQERKQNIRAQNGEHLKTLIEKEIEQYGPNCSLNHIDVSCITTMTSLFKELAFHGDMSQWNTSNVTDMSWCFFGSTFNGDISRWNTSRVSNMRHMFSSSLFNGEVSQWDVSQVTDMRWMFYGTPFNGDISRWDTSNMISTTCMFRQSHFAGDLRPWGLTEQQLIETFEESYPHYLAVRQSIQEREQLHTSFGTGLHKYGKKTL